MENYTPLIRREEFSQLLEPHLRKWLEILPIRTQIRRVQSQMREKRQGLYDPALVSLGPYHHGKPELQQAEEFKYLCLVLCADHSEEKMFYFYNKVYEKIDAIRGYYAKGSVVEKYNNKALAMMMLLDACIITSFMHFFISTTQSGKNVQLWLDCLGGVAMVIVAEDIVLLENQIPLEVIKLIISLKYESTDAAAGDGKYLLAMYISLITTGKKDQTFRIPREDENYPQHLVEACWRVMGERPKPNNEAAKQQADQILPISNLVSTFWRLARRLGKKKDEEENTVPFTCHSVTDLKAKGIHFKRTSSDSLSDIKFKSHAFHGEIHLRATIVSNLTKFLLSNMIAYELSQAASATEFAILSYVRFMKSLIQNPKDVEELQEKKILINKMGSHEQAIKLFHEIDTFGFDNFGNLNKVKQEIEEHCSSKAKTWMADLINTQFKSPWTAMALLAAVLLLCLTFTQTYFTIHPANSN